MSELLSELYSEEENAFVDAGVLLKTKEPKLSGESIPIVIDSARLEALRDFDVDDFETKLFPIKKDIKNNQSKFFQGKSKFFISQEPLEVDNNLEALMDKAKQEWEAKDLSGKNLIDLQTTDIVKVDKKSKKEYVEKLNKSIIDIREFIVNETSHTEIALPSVLMQSKQILESILGVNLKSSSKLLESMVTDAVRLKTFSFIADKLKLSKEEKNLIINKYFVLGVTSTNRVIETRK